MWSPRFSNLPFRIDCSMKVYECLGEMRLDKCYGLLTEVKHTRARKHLFPRMVDYSEIRLFVEKDDLAAVGLDDIQLLHNYVDGYLHS